MNNLKKKTPKDKYLNFALLTLGYSVQKTLQGRTTNIGRKISLLLYQWPLIYAKFGIWIGR